MKPPKSIHEALEAIISGASADEMESQLIDFKSDSKDAKQMGNVLAKAAICFANAQGGSIVLGVLDSKRGSEAIVGTNYDADWCRQRIHELANPSLITDAETFVYNGKTLLYIRIPQGIDVHEADGRFHRRVGSSCERMSAVEIALLIDERRQSDWSADDSDLLVGTTDTTAIAMLREQIGRTRDGELNLVPTDEKDMLAQFRLLSKSGAALSNAGAVAVGRDPEYWPRVTYTYRSSDGTEPEFLKTIHKTLLETLQDTLALIAARTQIFQLNFPDGTQLQIADFPSGAVRESVANALLHSDYRRGGAIVIEHSGDSLRITSPGRLPQGVTPGNILTHSSQPRNTRLFRFAELIRIAEERGLGIDRMVRESIKAGNPAPQIIEQGENTIVVFTKGKRNRSFINYILSLPANERDSVDTLLILHRLLTSKTLSTNDAARLIQKTTDEAASVMDRLAGLQVFPTYRTNERVQSSKKFCLSIYHGDITHTWLCRFI